MKPPPRRPAVFAQQNESEEERQFRKVFQQLAGDVGDVWLISCSLFYFDVVLVFMSHLLPHFFHPCPAGHGGEPG